MTETLRFRHHLVDRSGHCKTSFKIITIKSKVRGVFSGIFSLNFTETLGNDGNFVLLDESIISLPDVEER